jgi:calcium binding protein 39
MFFAKYNTMLIQSDSYVTKRQSIKLLGEILLDRANYNVMTQYVDSGDHLKIIMRLLRDDRKMINYEGFHVFKVKYPGYTAFVQSNCCRSSSRIQTSLMQFRRF